MFHLLLCHMLPLSYTDKTRHTRTRTPIQTLFVLPDNEVAVIAERDHARALVEKGDVGNGVLVLGKHTGLCIRRVQIAEVKFARKFHVVEARVPVDGQRLQEDGEVPSIWRKLQ